MAIVMVRRQCALFEGKKTVHMDYDLRRLCGLLQEEETEEPNVEMKARMGRQIVATLPAKFKSDNQGRYVAVTFSNKVLAVCDTLEALNRELANQDLKENYYIKRIGYLAITQV